MKTMIGTNLSVDQLRSIVERVENLEEFKAEVGADIREIYAEAAGNGYDKTAIRQIVKLRKKDASVRDEEEAILETYKRAMGMNPQLEDEESGA